MYKPVYNGYKCIFTIFAQNIFTMKKRFVIDNIIEGLNYFRVVYIDGARQVGKTTLVKQIAKTNNYNYVTLDDSDSLALAKRNVNAFFSINKTPIIIDEVQKAPNIIHYVKMFADNNPKTKGHFILTGSVDIIKSVNITESLAGRMVKYNLYPLSCSELKGQNFNWLDALYQDDFYKYFEKSTPQDYQHILNRLLIGGFPEVQNFKNKIHNKWFANYLQARINKDIKDLTKSSLQKADKLPQLLRLLADQTSDLLNNNSLAQKLSINHDTVTNYNFLLESMFIIERLAPYETNAGKQVKKMKKMYFTDTGFIKNLSKVTFDKLLNNRQLFGKFLENYIYIEIKKMISFTDEEYEIYYYRDNKTFEVDFIIENNEKDMICIEVKSAQKIESSDLRGLRSFKRNYGKKIKAMYVLYAGDKISALNIDDYPVFLLPYSFLF